MKNVKYDYLIITNLPAFYKINLYNKLSENLKIKVVFISKTSRIRHSDFSAGDMLFEHDFITDVNFEERNKLQCLIKMCKIILATKFNRVLFPGWELIELIPLMLLMSKYKSGIVIESSIIETTTTGLIWWIKKYIIRRMGHAFPSGVLQNDILIKAGFSGQVHVTHGVGLPNRTVQVDVDYKTIKTIKTAYKYLYIGRISKEKNLEYLVNQFNKNGKGLTIVGDGLNIEKLKSIANKNIMFTGYIHNSNLNELYRSHDVFILPSISEPWGLVIDEALSYGLPVIVSNHVGCLEDLVIRPNSGRVFDLNVPLSLDFAISDVEENYSLLKGNVLRINFTERDQAQINAYY